jgi:hypothetical protein
MNNWMIFFIKGYFLIFFTVVAGELRGFGKCMFVWEMRVNLAGEKSDN